VAKHANDAVLNNATFGENLTTVTSGTKATREVSLSPREYD
jgi:hypothetical protein